jgi:hypothetical protein
MRKPAERLAETLGSQLMSVVEEGDLDFDKADVQRLWLYVDGRIEKKPPGTQAELYMDLVGKLMNLVKSFPTGETKLRAILKDFKSNSL